MLLRIDVGGLNLPMNDPNNDYAVGMSLANSRPQVPMPKTSNYPTWGDWFEAFAQYVTSVVSSVGGMLVDAKPDEYDADGTPYQGMIVVQIEDDYASALCQNPPMLEFYSNSTGMIPAQANFESGTTSIASPGKSMHPSLNDPYAMDVSFAGVDVTDKFLVMVIKPLSIYTLDGQYRDNAYPGTVLGWADGEQGGVMKVISRTGTFLAVPADSVKLMTDGRI